MGLTLLFLGLGAWLARHHVQRRPLAFDAELWRSSEDRIDEMDRSPRWRMREALLRSITPGMTKGEVERLLGSPPPSNAGGEDPDVWVYPLYVDARFLWTVRGFLSVRFRDGRVVQVSLQP